MAKSPKKKRIHTIAGRSLLSMVLMGILMIIGTSIAASWQLVQQTIDIYEDYATSYVNTIATNINGDWITEYLKLDKDSVDPDVDKEELEQLQLEATDGEYYTQVLSLLATSVSYANLRYMYVVVPKEDEMIYIWNTVHLNLNDMELSSRETMDLQESAEFLEHDSYTSEEEEPMKAVMEGTWDGRMFLDTGYRGRLLGTCLAPVYDGKGNIVAVAGVDVDLADLAAPIARMCLNIFLAVTITLVLCMIIYYYLIRKRIIRPIVKLDKASQELVKNLDAGKTFQADIHTGDEIEALANSFEEMDVRLHRYIDENLAITAEQERMKTELDLAKRIQAGMLPSEFPPFPDKTEFDIYASMQPAKEVGGDFYDFFLVDDDHLALVIADVSGKGIPAALFMMMAMIMLQNYTLTGMSPKEVLEKVNNQICRNKEEMFVTVWLGILDIKSGVIVAANAGHEYPMLKDAGKKFELIKDTHGLVLGGMEDVSYCEYEMKLEPGSKLFVYTDGVAEATDPQNQLFGTQRTLEALNSGNNATPQELLERVHRSVDLFVGEAPQFDDLTMLCLFYYGEKGKET